MPKTKISKTAFEIFGARVEPPGSGTTISERHAGLVGSGCGLSLFAVPILFGFITMGVRSAFHNFKYLIMFITLFAIIYIAMLIVIGKKAGRKTFQALMNTETINLYDMSGELYESFLFREADNLRLSNDIETAYKLENKKSVPYERQVYILELMMKSGVSYTIHIGEEQEVKKLAETLAAFLNHSIIDEGRRNAAGTGEDTNSTEVNSEIINKKPEI